MSDNIEKAFVDEKDVPLEFKLFLDGQLGGVLDGMRVESSNVVVESRMFYRYPQLREGYALLAVCSFEMEGQKYTASVDLSVGKRSN